MADKHNEQGGDQWDDILHQLRQIRQQVQEQGPLPEQARAEVEDAFRQGFAHLENQVRDLRSGLKGSSGRW